MTTTLTAYLVRHGQTEFNATGRVQGWLDVPLDDVGRNQTELLRQRFASKRLDAIYSSPLIRAADTARAIAQATSAKVTLDDRLREYHMGDWSGMTGDEINAVSPGLHWDGPELQIPNGETAYQMHDRVTLFLRDVLAKHTGANDCVVIVSHGGKLAFDLPETNKLDRQPVRAVSKDPQPEGVVIPETEWRNRERANVLVALRQARFRVSGRGGAADLLGINPATLASRIKALGIDKRDAQANF